MENMDSVKLEEIYEDIRFDELVEEGLASDIGHGALDVAGFAVDFFGGQGAWFDAANAIWYLGEKNPLYAALSIISMIPLIGDLVGKGGKYLHAMDKGRKVGASMYKAGKTMKSAKTVSKLAKVKSTLKDPKVKMGMDKAFEAASKNEKLAPHIGDMRDALAKFANDPVVSA